MPIRPAISGAILLVQWTSIGQTVKELLPFYGVGLIVLGMMTYIPAMTLRF